MAHGEKRESQAAIWSGWLKRLGAAAILSLALSVAFVVTQDPALWLRGSIAIFNVILLLAAGWSMMRLMEVNAAGTKASSRYLKRMMLVTIVYIGGVFLAEFLFDRYTLSGVAAVGVALVPAAGALGFIWAIGRYLLEEEDEYVRMRETQKFLMATGFMMVIVTVYGFLEQYDLVPHVPAYYAFVIWCLGLGVAALFQWRRG
ncbi:MAG: hypothetical protein WBM93_05040 [Parasphingorhabdus sp.]